MDGLLLKKSSLTNETILEQSRSCRWLDMSKYFQWEGNMLVNDQGEFLIGGDSLCYEFGQNSNHKGFMISSKNNVMSLEDCRDICGQTDGCKHYLWHNEEKGQYANICVTLRGYMSLKPDDNVFAGFMECSEDDVTMTNVTSSEVKILKYSPHYFIYSQWMYEDMYLINPATGNVLTFTTEGKLEMLPKIDTETADNSQQWILDYNGKNYFCPSCQ